MLTSPKGQIKGIAIREFIAWYGREHGRQPLVDAVLRLPQEDQAHFEVDHEALGILPSTWYPAEIIHRALDSITAGRSRDEVRALAKDAGAATVRGMMKGAHKVVFSYVMTPRRYVRVVQTLWRLNYDSGRVDHEILAPNIHQSFVRDWKGHHAFLCALNFSARVTIYEEMGCNNLEIIDRYCVSDGNEECGSVFTWKE